MPGEDVESAYAAARELGDGGLGTVFTNLGERTTTAEQAAAVHAHYRDVIDAIGRLALPAHVSVKLTHLGLAVDRDACLAAVVDLAKRAESIGSMLWVDMEESEYVDATLTLYREARLASPRVGVCLQAYLRRTPADLDTLLALDPAIRLVKGAYREPKEIAFEKKRETDAAYLELAERLLDTAAARRAFAVFGTHDIALLSRIGEAAATRNVSREAWEVHMLYGIRTGDQRALASRGVAVRVLISYGENWFPWYMRRLAERPANVWFVVKNLW